MAGPCTHSTKSRYVNEMNEMARQQGASYCTEVFDSAALPQAKVHGVPAQIASGWRAAGRAKPFPPRLSTVSWKPPSNRRKLWDKNEGSRKKTFAMAAHVFHKNNH